MIVIDREGDYARTVYVSMKMPLLFQPRDMIMQMTRTVISDNIILWKNETIEHPDYPPEKERVRMDMIMYQLNEERGDDLFATRYFSVNLNGNIPTSILNMMLSQSAAHQVIAEAKALN